MPKPRCNGFRQRQWKEAATAFAAVGRTAPGHTDALLYQGKALVKLAKDDFTGQHREEARHEAERAVELDPNDASAHYLLGRIDHRLGKADPAAQHFSMTEELIRQERAKTGGMGMYGTEHK
jgi:Flp pilus assembly protein TadD